MALQVFKSLVSPAQELSHIICMACLVHAAAESRCLHTKFENNFSIYFKQRGGGGSDGGRNTAHNQIQSTAEAYVLFLTHCVYRWSEHKYI